MPNIDFCDHCGQPLGADRVEARLQGNQRALYSMVRLAGARGIGSREAVDRLYSHSRDGGPASTNIISVMVRQINAKVEKFGIAIRSPGGPGAVYRLEKVYEARPKHARRARHRIDGSQTVERSRDGIRGPQAPR
jgi:hypothetical protein